MMGDGRWATVTAAALLSLAVLAVSVSGGCRAENVSAARDVDPRLVRANTEFGFRLLDGLLREEPEKNVVISPASVSLALSMTYVGAGGDTREDMAATLGYEELDTGQLNEASADLQSVLTRPGDGVEIALANSLWHRREMEFSAGFLDTNRDYYGAETRALDFDDPGTADVINAWVKENTGGRIEDIVDADIDPDTVMFLINALYFAGDWAVPFSEELTGEAPFHRPDGRTDPVPMMRRDGEMDYLQGDGFRAVRLPYGEEQRVSMYVFLPAGDGDLVDFCTGLDAKRWSAWMDDFVPTEGTLLLPRFTAEYEAELEDVLTEMGMGVAFDEARANFSGMRPIPPVLYLKSVRHKTFIAVDEAGTEAAAATSVEVGIESAVQDRFTLEVNRPFFFAIRDDVTGVVLFAGVVGDPQ